MIRILTTVVLGAILGGSALAAPRTALEGVCLECERNEARKLELTSRPIAGARVWFEGRDAAGEPVLAQALSGGDGTFRIPGVPVGASGWLHLAHPDYYVRRLRPSADERAEKEPRDDRTRLKWPADHARKSTLRILRVEAAHERLRIGAERGAVIEGAVRGPDGEPVAGALVRAGGGSDHLVLETRTDGEGRYRIGAFRPEARTGIVVEAEGYRYTRRQTVRLEGPGHRVLDVTLARGGVVRGRFVPGPGRETVAGLLVRAEHETGHARERRRTSIDAEGRFVLRSLSPGERYTVSVIEPERKVALARSGVVEATVDGVDIVLEEGGEG